MSKLIVLLPAYNEEENVKELTETWLSYKNELKAKWSLDLKIVIINDGSKDNTQKIGESLQSTYENVLLHNHPQNMGLGEAVKTAVKYMVSNTTDGDFACLMDCDNTHHPRYVLDMLAKQKKTQADCVIASRYQKNATVKGVAGIRIFMSDGAKAFYSFILRVPKVRDYTCGYRLYTTNILKKAYAKYAEELISQSGFTCMAELLYKLYKSGAKFAEVPFELRYDLKKGDSKMHVMKNAIDSIRIAFLLRKTG